VTCPYVKFTTGISHRVTSVNNSPEVSKILTHFLSYSHELPQGAPTSPFIANLVLYNFDLRVSNLCKLKGLNYTRYFDDITVSGNRSIHKTCITIVGIARTCGFRVHLNNPKKFRIMPSSQLQVVTGIIVNGKKLRADKSFIENLKSNLSRLSAGDFSDVNLASIMKTTEGMISFLGSVDPMEARLLRDRLKKIKWNIYGFEVMQNV